MMKLGACANADRCGTTYDNVFKPDGSRGEPWLCALCMTNLAIARRKAAVSDSQSKTREQGVAE